MSEHYPLIEVSREQLQLIEEKIVPEVQATVLLDETISNFWNLDDTQHRWGLDAAFREFHQLFSKAVTPPGRWEGELSRRLYGYVQQRNTGIFVTVRLGFESRDWMSFTTLDHVLDMSFCWHLCENEPYPQLDVVELGAPGTAIEESSVLLLPSVLSVDPFLAAAIFDEDSLD